MRIDKFIWAVRLFKTRKHATEACQKEKVRLNEIVCKPSKSVSNNDVIAIYETSVWRKFKIKELPKSRIGTKLLEQHIIETTSEEDLQRIQQIKEINRQNNLLGIKGRPTKKDRRTWDDFHE